jgi:hypothetical protein
MRLIFVLLVLTVVAGTAQTTSQTSPGAIEGRAINFVAQEPISNAQVSLMGPPTSSNLSPEATARLNEQLTQIIESGNRHGLSPEAINSAVANPSAARELLARPQWLRTEKDVSVSGVLRLGVIPFT